MLTDIGQFLADRGLGTLTQDLFYVVMPDVPDNAVALYQYPGEPPLHVKGQKAPVRRSPRLQVVVRSKSTEPFVAKQKADTIMDLLSGFSGVLYGTHYQRITALTDPYFLARDTANRHYVTANYEARMDAPS